MSASAIVGLTRAARGIDQAAARIAAGGTARPAQPAGSAASIAKDVAELVLYERQFEASARVIARTESAIGRLLDVIV